MFQSWIRAHSHRQKSYLVKSSSNQYNREDSSLAWVLQGDLQGSVKLQVLKNLMVIINTLPVYDQAEHIMMVCFNTGVF